MKQSLLYLFLLFSLYGSAQLSCKTKTLGDGSTEKTCLHKNGKSSTIETWDKDQRFGTIKGFDSNSKELFCHYLRKVGGHASFSIEYYPNGQVSKVEFSDAPDGGIQFYNSTTRFSDVGVQIEFYETKYPHELELEYIKPVVQENPVILPKNEEPKREEVKCASIAQTNYQVQNTTNSKVKLKITAVPNNSITVQSKEVLLKPSETVVFDSLFTAERPINEVIYKAEIIFYKKTRRNKNLKFIESVPVDGPDGVRVYSWFVVSE